MKNNILKFCGNDKCFFCLIQEENSYFLVYAKNKSIEIKINSDSEYRYLSSSIKKNALLQINFLENENNDALISMIEVSGVEEFDKIIKILDILL